MTHHGAAGPTTLLAHALLLSVVLAVPLGSFSSPGQPATRVSTAPAPSPGAATPLSDDADPPPIIPGQSRGPDAGDLERIAASYRSDTPETDRLRFVPFGEGLPQSGQWRDGFAVADMNGDGHLDIVHGPPRKSFGTPVIFLGNGKGSWRRWQEASWENPTS